MRPFTVIVGIIAGSLVSLAFGLGVVLLVFWVLRNDHPQFAAELPEVGRAFVLFFTLAFTAGAAFAGTVRGRGWRYAPLGLMWLGLILVGWYYWPS